MSIIDQRYEPVEEGAGPSIRTLSKCCERQIVRRRRSSGTIYAGDFCIRTTIDVGRAPRLQGVAGMIERIAVLGDAHVGGILDMSITGNELVVITRYQRRTLSNMDTGGPVGEAFALKVIAQVGSGLLNVYRGSRPLFEKLAPVHADVCALDENDDDLVVDILDMLLCENVDPTQTVDDESVIVWAPERVEQRSSTTPRDQDDTKAQVWALAVTVYKLAAASAPWHGSSPLEVMRKLVDDPPEPIPDTFSTDFRDLLLNRMLAKDRHERISLAELVELPILSPYLRQPPGDPPPTDVGLHPGAVADASSSEGGDDPAADDDDDVADAGAPACRIQ
ncbi:Protein kinase domain-containing protein [Plasmodiophora brassicae]|uniref:mitogen-activated protein kinase kinase n=1 Tax=Plasmodiophora brassicae TaxID=37360 RepID=A0A0G4IS65_PLABS|nr:hypothetical protein PBRA_006307 [Plasmodiophora brassicae]SPQ95238.1 unnamed protein product [Plasmodiophora brassicae]